MMTMQSLTELPGPMTYVCRKPQETITRMISLLRVDSSRLFILRMTLPHQLKLSASFVYIKKIKLVLMELSINICELLSKHHFPCWVCYFQ